MGITGLFERKHAKERVSSLVNEAKTFIDQYVSTGETAFKKAADKKLEEAIQLKKKYEI